MSTRKKLSPGGDKNGGRGTVWELLWERECQCHLADGGRGLEESLFCLWMKGGEGDEEWISSLSGCCHIFMSLQDFLRMVHGVMCDPF